MSGWTRTTRSYTPNAAEPSREETKALQFNFCLTRGVAFLPWPWQLFRFLVMLGNKKRCDQGFASSRASFSFFRSVARHFSRNEGAGSHRFFAFNDAAVFSGGDLIFVYDSQLSWSGFVIRLLETDKKIYFVIVFRLRWRRLCGSVWLRRLQADAWNGGLEQHEMSCGLLFRRFHLDRTHLRASRRSFVHIRP